MDSGVKDLVIEAIEEAADAWRSERVGWMQGALQVHLGQGQVKACAVGGLMIAGEKKGQYPTNRTIAAQAEIAVRKKLLRDGVLDQPGVTGVASWNDHPQRTKQDVIDLFEEVAKDLRNQAGEDDARAT